MLPVADDLPTRLRPTLAAPATRLATAIARRAPGVMWRSLHPLDREPFVDGGKPPPIRRLAYQTADGWRAPLFVESERPGGSGVPVLVLHTVGLGPDSFRYGPRRWVDPWVEAGFRVYLGTWRGDREAEGPGVARFDDAAEHDVRAMIRTVLEDAGARRVLVVGHGIGGQLALGHVARHGDAHLAGLALFSARVCFERATAAVRAGLAAAGRLAGTSSVPRQLAAAAAVLTPPSASGPRLRGTLLHAAEDIPVGLLEQLATWLRAGALVDRSGGFDYTAALRAARAPLWVAAGVGDTWCPPEHVLPVRGCWGGRDITTAWLPDDHGHLDVVVHPDALRTVESLVAWAECHRHRAWGERPTDLGRNGGPRGVR